MANSNVSKGHLWSPCADLALQIQAPTLEHLFPTDIGDKNGSSQAARHRIRPKQTVPHFASWYLVMLKLMTDPQTHYHLSGTSLS